MDAARVTDIKERAERALKYDQPYGPPRDVLDLLNELKRLQGTVEVLRLVAGEKWETEASLRASEKARSEAQEATRVAQDETEAVRRSPIHSLCEEGCIRQRFAEAWG